MTPADRQAMRRARRQAGRVVVPDRVPNHAAVFHDIQVVPADAYRHRSMLTNGGPVWPDFDAQTLVRFMQGGRYVDAAVAASPGPLRVIDRACVWGGYAIPHFGHLVADQMTRVLEARVNRPDDLFLFVTRPGVPVADMPGFVWQVLDWYGLARDQVHLVTEPLLVPELRCYAQAEPSGSGGPSQHYLDLLAVNAVARGLQPLRADLVYVCRAGLLAMGKGGLAGEAYVMGLLARLGVRVLDPSQASLREQLAVYEGARVLVFAEGSAMHGRQLLGQVDQQIVILNRRPGARLAQAALAARCTQLRYVDACAHMIIIGSMAARKQKALAVSLYDLTALFACFAGYGIDLQAAWDQVAFAAAVQQDAEAWLRAQAFTLGAAVFDLEDAYRQLHTAGVPVGRVFDAEGA